MKHSGKAFRAGLKIIGWTLVLLLAIVAGGVVATLLGSLIASLASLLIGLWIFFALFTLYFFRDPEPVAPSTPNAVVAPGQGKVDLIGEAEEPEFLGGRCQRVSIFLSVFDVHVQRAPVAGRVAFLRHREGQFLSATAADCGLHNENVLIGLECAEPAGQKVAFRLIAGLIARRIVPWVTPGETVARSERVSLIQFGSRVDLYLPLTARIHVRLGDRVKAGETVVASLD
ncbi:MAG TPA: phosphatidylserine decarboxylase [Methylomirabilota bacterium]|nr:phosphatidylserine decarboxylase [Methylomirabilota bacterium]